MLSPKIAMDNSLRIKRVKFNRKKHKITVWITFDIIKTTNERNQNYHDRNVKFNAYKTTLRKTITVAKKLY